MGTCGSRGYLTLAVGLVALGTTVCGCAPKPVDIWRQPAQVRWDDVAGMNVPPVYDGYAVLDQQKSQGRFPCAVAVSRVAIAWDQHTGQRQRMVPVTPHNEFLIWNSAFDDLWQISEVFPIAQRALGGAPVEPKLLVDVAHKFHGQLSLIYGFNVVSPQRTEMLGVLHESASGEPVAVIHASAESVIRPDKQAKVKNNLDAWRYDARALTRARFETLMVDCMRELIARDTPSKIDVPEGWTPVRPNFPILWPPQSPR